MHSLHMLSSSSGLQRGKPEFFIAAHMKSVRCGCVTEFAVSDCWLRSLLFQIAGSGHGMRDQGNAIR